MGIGVGFVLMSVTTIGCKHEEEMARIAKDVMEMQAKQNEVIARQSEAITQGTDKIASAAKDLVEMDAQARLELIEGQRQLNSELHAERSALDERRMALDEEARLIASQRRSDLIVAESIRSVGMLFVAITPFILAAYSLSKLHGGSTVTEELNELLIDELADSRSGLLSVVGSSTALPSHRQQLSVTQDERDVSQATDESPAS